MLTIMIRTLLWLDALKVARMSDELATLKLADPIKPTIR